MGASKSKPVHNIVCIGLDNAGKTTIVNHIKPEKEQVDDIVPTVGFNTEKFRYGSANLTVHDMSGAKQYRSLWKENFDDANGLIFVIDAADHLRVVVAESELSEATQLAPASVPILILCNKSDLPSALSKTQIATSIRAADHCGTRPWSIVATSGVSGEGIKEGMAWLTANLTPAKK